MDTTNMYAVIFSNESSIGMYYRFMCTDKKIIGRMKKLADKYNQTNRIDGTVEFITLGQKLENMRSPEEYGTDTDIMEEFNGFKIEQDLINWYNSSGDGWAMIDVAIDAIISMLQGEELLTPE